MKHSLPIVITLLLARSLPAFAQTGPVATSPTANHTMDEFRRIITNGIQAGTNPIIIPPGVYRGGPEKGRKVIFQISDLSDRSIVADGVTMLCTDASCRALEFSKCRNVTLEGLTLDYDPLPFTQGDITAVNPGEEWLDIKIHAGYPVVPAPRIDIVDRATRFRKKDKPFMWDSRSEVLEGGIVRVHSKSAAGFAQVGDLASLGGVDPALGRVVAHAVVLEYCDSMTLKNVTVFSSNCMGIVAGGGEGGHRFVGCRVLPGPPPPGATEARILSTNADAILTESLRKGVLTENCEIRDAGDDSWSVQSHSFVIVNKEGKTVWLGGSTHVEAGDRLQASLETPALQVVSCEKVRAQAVELPPDIVAKIAASRKWQYWHINCLPPDGWITKVTFQSEPAWVIGDSVFDPDRQGNGFVFRKNRVRSSGRILIKAAGTVEDNRIEGLAGVSAMPEVPWPAAAGIEKLVIRNNILINAHMHNPFPSSSQAGAISVTNNGPNHQLRSAGTYGEVIIEANTIRGGNGAAIVVSSARKVLIESNQLDGILHIPPSITGSAWKIDNHAAVYLSECDDVLLRNNQLLNAGPHMSQPVVTGPGVKKLEGSLANKAF